MESSSPGQVKQSAAGVSATPTIDQCNMKLMRKHVVNRLSPYCTVVCQHLGYTTTGLGGDNKKNLIAVLEHWISSGENEGRPKTWSLFIGILSNISELSTVTNEICSELYKAGVVIIMPSSRLCDPTPSHPQFHPAMIQDSTSFLTDGHTSQSTAGAAATPTNENCNMKLMRKYVVNKLSSYWVVVYKQLGCSYSTTNIGHDNKKNLIAILEDWINTGENEGRPKTWSMFIGVLHNISDLSAVTSEICSELRSEGVYIDPPTSGSHNPSPSHPQFRPAMIHDYTSSLTCVTDGPNKPSGEQATSFAGRKCDMRTMYKYVINKLLPHWTTLGDYLEYSVAERNGFRAANDNKKSLVALLENWISTDNGRGPKTWATFIKVLKELDQDLTISVGSEIIQSFEEGGLLSPSTQLRPSGRSASYSSPPGQNAHHGQFKSSHSFPRGAHPISSLHLRPHGDIKRELDYNMDQMSITEETPKLPLKQSVLGQPNSVPQQPPQSIGFPRSFSQCTPTAGRYPHPTAAPMMPGSYHSPIPSRHASLMPRNWHHPSSGHPSVSPPSHAFTSISSPQLRSVQHAIPGNAPLPFHPKASRGAAQRALRPFNQRQFDPHQQGTLLHHHQTQQGDPYFSLRPPPPPQRDPQSEYSMYTQHNRVNYEPQKQLTEGQQQRRQENQCGHPPIIHEHYPQSLPSHGHTIDQPQSMQRQRQDGHSSQPLYQEGSQSRGHVSNQTTHDMSAEHQPWSLPQTPQHGMAGSSQCASRQQVDKQFTSVVGQQFSQEAVLKQEDRQTMTQKYFTEHRTIPIIPVSGFDDKVYEAEQYRLQMSGKGQHPGHSQEEIDHHGDHHWGRHHGVTGHHNNIGAATNVEQRKDHNVHKSPTETTSPNATKTSGGQHFNVSFVISSSHTSKQSVAQNAAHITSAQLSVNAQSQNASTSPTNRTTSVAVEQATSINQSTINVPVSSAEVVATVTDPGKWKKKKKLGQGAFGEVFLCTDEDSGRELAVKEVKVDPNFSNSTRKAVESLEKEMRILQKIKHLHIVQYYGTERSETCVRIFMEYMEGGSLYHYIDQKGPLGEGQTSNYTKQLLKGIEYLHERGVVHRDIKGLNILLDCQQHHIKIADFGASKLLRSIYVSMRTHEKGNNSHKSVAGTAYWMAPEVIRGQTVNQKADIWSIGCTVVEMLTCRPPYGHLESVAAIFKIATEPMSVNLPLKSSDDVHDFLSQCFTSEVSNRPQASVLLEHRFVNADGSSSCSSAQGSTVVGSSSQVTPLFSTQATRVAELTVTTNQPSSDSNDDDTVDDDTTDGHVAATMVDEDIETMKKTVAKPVPSYVQSVEPQSETATETLTVNATTVSSAPKDESNAATGRSTPTNLYLKQDPASFSANTTSAGSASNVADNSSTPKLLADKATVPSNMGMATAEWQNCEQFHKASNAFIHNILGNYPTPLVVENLVVQMYLMKGNQITFSPNSSSPVTTNIDYGDMSFNSLKPYTHDICSSINVNVILPSLISHGLVTPSDQQYFTNPIHTDIEKQQKLACLAVSLKEDCVEKFIQCLSDTSSDCAPHDSLLKKLRAAGATTS